MTRFSGTILAAAPVMVTGSATTQNLVANGSFESPPALGILALLLALGAGVFLWRGRSTR